MTEYRVEQYGSVIFGTTKLYHEQRMEYLKSMATARQDQLQEEARARAAEPRSSSVRSRRSGGKGRGRGKKRKTKTSKSSAVGRGRGRTVSSGSTSKPGTSSSKVGSMGMPSRFGAAASGLYTLK